MRARGNEPPLDPIARAWASVIRHLGYEPDDPHLVETPARVERFMREWHTMGKPAPRLTVFPSDGADEMVAVGGIQFYSLCQHHALPFFGTAAIGYVPSKRGGVVGLSKLARVVDHFARRFQVQEQLTRDVAHHLAAALKPKGLGVVLRAEHLCMSMRGIQKPGHQTVTSAMLGVFRSKPEARAELLELIDGGRR